MHVQQEKYQYLQSHDSIKPQNGRPTTTRVYGSSLTTQNSTIKQTAYTDCLHTCQPDGRPLQSSTRLGCWFCSSTFCGRSAGSLAACALLRLTFSRLHKNEGQHRSKGCQECICYNALRYAFIFRGFCSIHTNHHPEAENQHYLWPLHLQFVLHATPKIKQI